MKILLLVLGSQCKDIATGLKGMITHCDIGLDRTPSYIFQPAGLSPDDKQPLKSLWAAQERFPDAKSETVDLPLEVLGTEVEDIATGFKGTAINLVQYLSGCVHIVVQPKGTTSKGEVVKSVEFDIRRLKGKMVPKMTPEEIKKDQKEKPSPGELPPRRYE